jgi:hypothetical protein
VVRSLPPTMRSIPGSRPILIASASALTAGLAPAGHAQGIGPPRGTEILLVLFLVSAAFFVLVVSTILYLVVKRALFGNGKTSRWQRLGIFGGSLLVSAMLGTALMIMLELR